MIKEALKTKLGSALAITAVVVSVGGIATVSAAQPSGSSPAAATTGYGKDQCKNGGWKNFKNPDGSQMFKNQGQCVAFFASGGKNNGNSNSSSNQNHTTQNTDIRQNVTSGNADNGAASGNVSAASNVSVSSATNSSTSN